MAYGQIKNEEHAFQKIQKDIKSSSIKNVILFYGKEEYLMNWSIETIIEKMVNPATKAMDLSIIDGRSATVDEIVTSCETLPMMSNKRVVIVKGFLPLEGQKLKGYSEDDESQLASYIERLSDSTLLIFTARSIDKRKKVIKSILNFGCGYDFEELDEKMLKGFITKRLTAAEKTTKPSVITQFIQSTGYYHKETDYNLYNLENDIKKAIAHSQNPELSLEDFLGTVSGNLDTNVFAMLDAVSKGQKGEALKFLYNILNSGESIYKILSLLCSQFELMLSAKELKEEGFSFKEISKELGVHEFRVKKALQFADSYSLLKSREILKEAFNIDRNIKKGILGQNLALEMFVVSI